MTIIRFPGYSNSIGIYSFLLRAYDELFTDGAPVIDLFTYGSLMFESVWRMVVGKRFPSEPGVLPGYAVYRMRGEAYPGVVEASVRDQVSGLVYRGVDEEALWRLDAFEGECYFRKVAAVLVGPSSRAPCHVYVVKPDCRRLMSDEGWKKEWFEKHGLASFLRDSRGFAVDR